MDSYSISSFPSFQKLPLELQNEIIKAAVEPFSIYLEGDSNKGNPFNFTGFHWRLSGCTSRNLLLMNKHFHKTAQAEIQKKWSGIIDRTGNPELYATTLEDKMALIQPFAHRITEVRFDARFHEPDWDFRDSLPNL